MSKPTETTPPLTRERIALRERLYPRVAALRKQVERAKGTEAAPVESVRLGRELCGEVARFLGRAGRGIGVPREAGIDNAALAIALGQALAGLEAFEGEHARLSAKHQASV